MNKGQSQDKVFDFFQHLIFVRLIGAGKSNMSDRYADMVKQGYTMALDILQDAVKKGDAALYNRIFIATGDLIPGAGLKNFMSDPEIYPTLLQYKINFLKQVNDYVSQHAAFMKKYRYFLQNQYVK